MAYVTSDKEASIQDRPLIKQYFYDGYHFAQLYKGERLCIKTAT